MLRYERRHPVFFLKNRHFLYRQNNTKQITVYGFVADNEVY